MDDSGNIRYDAIEKQAEWLVESGVTGAFICGTTGEGLSLTNDERKRVAERWIEVSGPTLPVIVHVGHDCMADAVELASHAAAKGAFATAAMAPPFFKPSNVEQLNAFLKPIAAAASDLPFYFYHLPSMTGVHLSMVEFLSARQIPNLEGIKYAHGNIMEFQQCLALDQGRYELFFGQDENLLAALAFGAKSAVGSTYNYAAPIYQRMMNALEKKNLPEAQACSAKVVAMVEILMKYGVLPSGKALMSLVAVDCGPPRAPVPSLTKEQRRRLFAEIESLDVIGPPVLPPARPDKTLWPPQVLKPNRPLPSKAGVKLGDSDA
jgi:N-acetylneuraminate lyase